MKRSWKSTKRLPQSRESLSGCRDLNSRPHGVVSLPGFVDDISEVLGSLAYPKVYRLINNEILLRRDTCLSHRRLLHPCLGSSDWSILEGSIAWLFLDSPS